MYNLYRFGAENALAQQHSAHSVRDTSPSAGFSLPASCTHLPRQRHPLGSNSGMKWGEALLFPGHNISLSCHLSDRVSLRLGIQNDSVGFGCALPVFEGATAFWETETYIFVRCGGLAGEAGRDGVMDGHMHKHRGTAGSIGS